MAESKRGEQSKYTEEQLEDFAQKLRALPPVERKKSHFTRPEAIAKLKGEIDLLKERGYTLEETAEALQGIGIRINVATLKSYLQRHKNSNASRSRSTKAKKTTGTSRDAIAPRTESRPSRDAVADEGALGGKKNGLARAVLAEASGSAKRDLSRATFELKQDTDDI